MFGFGSSDESKQRKVPVKIEPKTYFANERTFLHWMHTSVTLSSISIAILAFSGENRTAQIYGVMLLPIALAFCSYSLYIFHSRAKMIRERSPGPYFDGTGPTVLTTVFIVALLLNFSMKIYEIAAH